MVISLHPLPRKRLFFYQVRPRTKRGPGPESVTLDWATVPAPARARVQAVILLVGGHIPAINRIPGLVSILTRARFLSGAVSVPVTDTYPILSWIVDSSAAGYCPIMSRAGLAWYWYLIRPEQVNGF